MFLLSLLSLLPRLLLGFWIIHWVWNTTDKKYLPVKIFLSGAIGFGVSSLASFLWIWIGFHISIYVIVEFLVVLVWTIFILYKNYKSINFSKLQPLFQNKINNYLYLILTFCLLAFAFFLAVNILDKPQGNMDAWTNWNVVSRFIYRGGENWQSTFLRMLDHPDYPFFMPLTNAITWAYLQKDSFIGPIALHFALSFLMIGLLSSFVNALKTFQQAVLLIILFIAQPMATSSMSQYADFPLAYIILAVGGLTLIYFQTRQSQIVILIGFLVGLAAWTKNEGIIIVIGSTLTWFLIAFLNELQVLKKYFAGLLFPLVIVILFKVFLAPENDVVSGAQNIFANLINLDRIFYILKNFGIIFWNIGGGAISLVAILFIYAILIGNSSQSISGGWAIGLIIFIQFFSYFIIYLITPYDLRWHIKTSMNRLIFHLVPLLLLWLFTWIKSPEEIWLQKEG